MTDNDNSTGGTSRRTFLRATAAAATVGGVAGAVGARQGNLQYIVLDGRTPGWRGRAPQSLRGETNPPLPLVPGQEYRVVWTNVDGQPHNFVVLDGGGNALVSTDIISSQGATQEVTFTASEQMAEYYCEVHPSSMRGNVQLVQEQQLQPVNESQLTTQTENQTADDGTDLRADQVPQPIGLTNESFNQTNESQLQEWRQNRQQVFNQTGNGTVRGNLTRGAEATASATNETQATQGAVSTGDVRQVARAPGFGVLTALGGLLGGASLLSNRSEE